MTSHEDDELTPEQRERRALMRRAEDLARGGDRAGASAIYAGIHERFPTMPEPVIRLGILRRADNDQLGAIDFFTRALALDPGSRVLCLRAGSLLALGRLDEAMADVEASLMTDPGEQSSLLLRARVLVMLARDDEARRIVDDLLARQEQPDALNLRADLHERSGDAVAAARDRARAREVVAGPRGIFAGFWKPRK